MNNNKFYILVADWCPYCRAAKSAIFDLVEKYYSNNNIVLIEKKSLEDFLFSINQLNLKLEKADIVSGYNIAKGKHVEIHIYKNQMFDQSN